MRGQSSDFKDYRDVWQVAESGWASFNEEAEKDTRAFCGDQWSDELKAYLKGQGRSTAVYNKILRVVNSISGYEIRNQHSLIARPRGNSDDMLANQQSAILLNVMSNYGGYDTCSEAFKMGTCVSGLNLVEVFIDSTGNVGFNRDAYNQVLVDPLYTKPDFSDCAYILRERPMTKDQAKLFFPGQEQEIESLHTSTASHTFSRATHNTRVFTQDQIVYGEYHRQTTRNAIFLVDLQTGIETEFKGSQQDLAFIFQNLQQQFQIKPKLVKSMRVQIFLQDQLFYDGPDRYGIEEYRFTPVTGLYVPELPNDQYKLQGIVRAIREPQTEFNKRMSQEVDMFESQIASGWIAEDGMLVDPESIYQTGQGVGMWVKNRADGNHAGVEAIKRIPAPTIGPGMDQLSNKQADLIDSMSGANQELLGADTKDIPNALARLRTGAALTTLQPYFKGYRVAKRRIGKLVIQMVQKNYPQGKIEQILEQPMHPEFQKMDIFDNDISVQEGLMTESQREMAYLEYKNLKAEGAPIPWSAILEQMPVAAKDNLTRHMKQAEEAQQKQAADQSALERHQLLLNSQLIQSETAKNMASVQKTESEIIENLAEAVLDQVKALVLKEDHDVELSHPTGNAGHGSHDTPRKPRHKSGHKKEVA